MGASLTLWSEFLYSGDMVFRVGFSHLSLSPTHTYSPQIPTAFSIPSARNYHPWGTHMHVE